jgi:hypothetical protein
MLALGNGVNNAIVTGIISPADGLDIGASDGLLAGGCITPGTTGISEEVKAGAATEEGISAKSEGSFIGL